MKVKFVLEREKRYIFGTINVNINVIRVRRFSYHIGILNSLLFFLDRGMRSFTFSHIHIGNHINIEIKKNRNIGQLQLIILDLTPNGVIHINRARKLTIPVLNYSQNTCKFQEIKYKYILLGLGKLYKFSPVDYENVKDLVRYLTLLLDDI